MNFVDEEHVTFHEIRQHRGQVSGPLQCGAGRHAQGTSQFLSDNHRHRGLAQPRRAGEQHVIRGDTTVFRAIEHER